MKRLLILGAVTVGLAAVAAVGFVVWANRPLSKPGVEENIRGLLQAAARDHPDRAGASLLVHSDRLNLHVIERADPAGNDAFHIASVGKLFTAVLIGRLIDERRLRYDDRIAPFFAKGELDGLFVVGEADHQSHVTVEQLLAHTSGVPGYYADPPKTGKPVFELLSAEPKRRWTSPADFGRVAVFEQVGPVLPTMKVVLFELARIAP